MWIKGVPEKENRKNKERILFARVEYINESLFWMVSSSVDKHERKETHI